MKVRIKKMVDKIIRGMNTISNLFGFNPVNRIHQIVSRYELRTRGIMTINGS
jgi:hypothetical protein